jgi:hypothetical protein
MMPTIVPMAMPTAAATVEESAGTADMAAAERVEAAKTLTD